MRLFYSLILLVFLFLPAEFLAAEKGLTVKGVRHSTYAAFTRIVFEVEAAAPYVLTRSRDGKSVMLGSYEGAFVLKAPLPMLKDGVVAGIEPREEGGRTFAVIRLDAAAGEVKDFTLRGPDRIVLDIAKGSAPASAATPGEGRIVVVLDPGHGGRDAGLLTGQGPEKTMDLELAFAVRKILRGNERIKAIMTREKDHSLSFDERAALANSAGASVYVSIHAAPGEDARVYIQDLADDAGSPASGAAPVSGDFLGFEAGSEQEEMAWGKQQAAHAQESAGLGRKLARQLANTDLAEPLPAPLAALKAVDGAAVLVEVGMARDRARTAGELARGIEQYVLDAR
jgi:N-acetylmuramoyl-L-alanine amidase